MHGLVDVLKQNLPPCSIFWDELIPLGSNWHKYLQGEMEKAGIVVAFLGMEGLSPSLSDKVPLSK